MDHVLPTLYNGIKYRSRTEARWAMYFDLLGHKFIYEPEGFDLGNGIWYLPDFYLPESEIFAEVKFQEFSEEEKDKCRMLCIHTGMKVFMLDGPPDFKRYWYYGMYETGAWVDDPGGDLPDFVYDGGRGVHEDDVQFMAKHSKYYPFYWSSGYSRSQEAKVNSEYCDSYHTPAHEINTVKNARFDKHPAHLN